MPDDSEVDGLILGGYGALLKKACEGLDIILNQKVINITYKENKVLIKTANKVKYFA